MKPLYKRILFILSVAALNFVLSSAYKDFVSVIYRYTGLGYREISFDYLFYSWILALLPALWIPIKIERPSQLIYIIFYFIVYLPPIFIMYHVNVPTVDPNTILGLIVVMFIGFSIMGSSYLIPLLKVNYRPISRGKFVLLISAFVLAVFIYLSVTSGRSIKLILDFNEVYNARNDFSERVAEGNGAGFSYYAILILSNLIIPFALSLFAFQKKKLLFSLFMLAPLFLYAIVPFKMILFFPAFYVFILILLQKKTSNYFTLLLSLCLTLMLISTYLVNSLPVSQYIKTQYVHLVSNRIFTIPAHIQLMYFDFFSKFPPTYLSHVHGISWFIHYPYPTYLTTLIPSYYFGSGSGANASPWSMDGLAGFGLAGIIIISILMGFVFWIFDSISSKYKTEFVVLCSSYIALFITSVGFFTTLLSGGLLLLLFILYTFPRDVSHQVTV